MGFRRGQLRTANTTAAQTKSASPSRTKVNVATCDAVMSKRVLRRLVNHPASPIRLAFRGRRARPDAMSLGTTEATTEIDCWASRKLDLGSHFRECDRSKFPGPFLRFMHPEQGKRGLLPTACGFTCGYAFSG